MDISVTKHDAVAVISWNEGENRINLDSLGRINEIFDELDKEVGPLAIVLTGSGKFFCNGLDLDRFGENPVELSGTLKELQRTIGRILVFPAYTVAALNGHTYAGGALFSCAFDQRVMREDRGFWCMNETAIGMPLDEKLYSILLNRLPRVTAVDAGVTARKYSGPEALKAGIVESVKSEDEVLSHAIAIAQAHTTLDRKAMGWQKSTVHGPTAEFIGFARNKKTPTL
jgi:enoyl-CoA hydratase/carnithine racemase